MILTELNWWYVVAVVVVLCVVFFCSSLFLFIQFILKSVFAVVFFSFAFIRVSRFVSFANRLAIELCVNSPLYTFSVFQRNRLDCTHSQVETLSALKQHACVYIHSAVSRWFGSRTASCGCNGIRCVPLHVYFFIHTSLAFVRALRAYTQPLHPMWI